MILSFKKQFVPSILNGDKIHTIREDKHSRWKKGNQIHFATGARTKRYNQFFGGECKSVQGIILVNHGNHVYCRIQTGENTYIHNDCCELEHIKWYSQRLERNKSNQIYGLLGDLCQNDGLGWDDFKKWFVPNQGDKFVGKIIHWTDFRYTNTRI